VVKINLRGKCKKIERVADIGIHGLCIVRVQLDSDVSSISHLHEIQFLVPAKFGTLLEVGLPVTVSLEQGWN
jgi:hypothetical protein